MNVSRRVARHLSVHPVENVECPHRRSLVSCQLSFSATSRVSGFWRLTHRRASPWTMLAAAARPALPALASRAPAIRGARSATRVSASAEGTAFWDKMVAKASGKTTTTEVALFALG